MRRQKHISEKYRIKLVPRLPSSHFLSENARGRGWYRTTRRGYYAPRLIIRQLSCHKSGIQACFTWKFIHHIQTDVPVLQCFTKERLNITFTANANLYHVTKFPITCSLLFIISTHKLEVTFYQLELFWAVFTFSFSILRRLPLAIYMKLKLSNREWLSKNWQVKKDISRFHQHSQYELM